MVQNAGTQATTVRAYYYNDNGQPVGSVDRSLPPNGSATFDQSASDHSFLGNNFHGSALVTSLQGMPLAVHSYTRHYSQPYLLSNVGLSSGATRLSMPALFDHAYGGWNASFGLKNLGGAAADVEIRFVPRPGHTYSCTDRRSISVSYVTWLPAYDGPCTFPDGWAGSAVVTSLNGQPLIGVVHQDEANSYQYAGYSALPDGSTTVVLPYLPRNAGGLNGSFAIQNTSSGTTNVTIRYYRSDGTGPYIYGPYAVNAGQAQAWYLPDVSGLTDGLYSAVVTSSGQPIIGVASGHVSGSAGDYMMSYDGINR